MTINNEQIQALRDKFETAVMEKICISKSTLIGLRTDEGYRNSTLSGHDYQGDWEFFVAGHSYSLAERDADKALIAEQVKQIDELEDIRAASERLVRCKGRYHSEQNYRSLAALFGVSAPDLPPLDSEASTVTVKLPPVSFFDFKLGSAFASGAYVNVEAMNKALAAAGITLDVGE